MVFYSRYYIHETLLVVFSFGALLAVCRYLQRPGPPAALVAGVCGGPDARDQGDGARSRSAACSLALAAVAFAERRRAGAAAPGLRAIRARDALVALAAAAAVAALLFSSFLSHPAGVVDAVRAYAYYLERAPVASWHVHPWHYYLRLLVHFPRAARPSGPRA